MKQLQNKKGFSLIFAMGIVLSISLTTIYLLEYVIPFAKDTKGIEFSTNAYYQSVSAVEEGLFFVANNNLGEEGSGDPLLITGSTLTNTNTDFGYNIVARGYTIPPAREGNSTYDPDWNVLAAGSPLQIEIGGNVWNNAEIELQLPKTGIGGGALLTQTGGIITWQLNAQNDSLISDSEASRVGNNLLRSATVTEFNINNKQGKNLNGGTQSFDAFYNNNCSNTNDTCSLKLSIINELVLNDSERTPVPFIEYKIKGLDNAPLRYTQVNTEGYSKGFKKDINIKIPQQTVNEAFDFTIFQ